MEQETNYSIGAFIEGLQILAKYMENGLETTFALCADHDIIYTQVNVDKVTPEEAEKLESLKFHKDSENETWAYFT